MVANPPDGISRSNAPTSLLWYEEAWGSVKQEKRRSRVLPLAKTAPLAETTHRSPFPKEMPDNSANGSSAGRHVSARRTGYRRGARRGAGQEGEPRRQGRAARRHLDEAARGLR